MTACYWEIGRRIVEQEQKGRHAGYGERLIDQLAPDLTVRFGRSGVAHLCCHDPAGNTPFGGTVKLFKLVLQDLTVTPSSFHDRCG
jgi:hypothetical protein